MQGTFHWFRVQVFCYATEDESLIHDSMVELLGTDEFECDVAESEHGNRLIVLGTELTKQRTIEPIFKRMGENVISRIIDDIDNRIDDDCVFYLRLDKQKLVKGEYKIAHHGDVLSLTGKVVSHPARKEIATRNLLQFFNSIQF
jgi:Predicted exosome subunit